MTDSKKTQLFNNFYDNFETQIQAKYVSLRKIYIKKDKNKNIPNREVILICKELFDFGLTYILDNIYVINKSYQIKKGKILEEKNKKLINQKKVTFEQIGLFIVNYQEIILQIVDNYCNQEKDKKHPYYYLDNVLLNKISPDYKEKIIEMNKTENSEFIDAENTIFDLNNIYKSFGLNLHATATYKTTRQTELMFKMSNADHRNIYLIGQIYTQKNQSNIFKPNVIFEKINWLSFISMIKKLEKEQFSLSNNVLYFFKTYLIISNQNTDEYNNTMINIYAKNSLNRNLWLSSLDYSLNHPHVILQKIYTWLTEYILYVCNSVKFDYIINHNPKLEGIDRFFFSQLGSLINSYNYLFDRRHNLIEDYFYKIKLISNKYKDIHIDELMLNIKKKYNDFSVENHSSKISHLQKKYSIGTLNITEDLFLSHLDSEFKFDIHKLKKKDYSNFNSYFKKDFYNLSLEKQDEIVATLLFSNFPGNVKNIIYKEKEMLSLLLYFILKKTKKELMSYLTKSYKQISLPNCAISLKSLKAISEDYFKIFLISCLIYPDTTYQFDNLSSIRIKKIIYKYWDSYRKIQIINNEDKKDLFDLIIDTYKESNKYPSLFLYELLFKTKIGNYNLFLFYDYLSIHDKESQLKEAVLYYYNSFVCDIHDIKKAHNKNLYHNMNTPFIIINDYHYQFLKLKDKVKRKIKYFVNFFIKKNK